MCFAILRLSVALDCIGLSGWAWAAGVSRGLREISAQEKWRFGLAVAHILMISVRNPSGACCVLEVGFWSSGNCFYN